MKGRFKGRGLPSCSLPNSHSVLLRYTFNHFMVKTRSVETRSIVGIRSPDSILAQRYQQTRTVT